LLGLGKADGSFFPPSSSSIITTTTIFFFFFFFSSSSSSSQTASKVIQLQIHWAEVQSFLGRVDTASPLTPVFYVVKTEHKFDFVEFTNETPDKWRPV
jgi:hypothetical protein